MHLVNVCSLTNKMDLLLLNRTSTDFCRSATLCFTEIWLGVYIPYSSLHLQGFQLLRANCTELSGKTRGVGICFYMLTKVGVQMSQCWRSHAALSFFINCKPFYSPREFSLFILDSVSEALQHLADQITNVEQKHLDSLLIVLGDFNRANLSHEPPKFRQHIKCPTRDTNILGHCYTTLKDAYRSVSHAALGLSDHYVVHLILTYRQKLRKLRSWTNIAKLELLLLHWLECFWGCSYITWMNSLTLWHLTSVFVRTCVCQPKPSAHTITTNPGLQKNSGSFIRPRRRPTEMGTESYITWLETHWRRRSE